MTYSVLPYRMRGQEPGNAEPDGPAANRKSKMPEETQHPDHAVWEHKRASLNCQNCLLHATRTQVVFGEGNPKSPLMLVGEGPGETEDQLGRPFVGRAGKLLDECLQAAGMMRRHIWISNTVKCRACMLSDSGNWVNRPPSAEEILSCKPILAKEIELIRPLVILCIGGPAANTLIHTGFRIVKERGQWFQNTPWAPYVMATLHPAYVLRQFGGQFEENKRLLIQDLIAAKQKAREAKSERPLLSHRNAEELQQALF